MNGCTCGCWTVKGANFCFRCGRGLRSGVSSAASSGSSFNYETGDNNALVVAPSGRSQNQPIKEKMATTGLLAMATSTGAMFAGWDPGWIALVPMTYIMWDPIKDLILDLVLTRSEKTEVETPTETTIKIEHVSDDKRHWVLNEMPQGVTMAHLQHVARVCLPPPIGEGAPFSRENVHKKGILSQPKFKTINKFFLETHYSFYRVPDEPRQGVVLTERAKRLLKKSLQARG